MMSNSTEISELEACLNSFSPQVRTSALHQLVDLANAGKVECRPVREVANMHCHTFYSYNAYGYSPSALAWMAKKNGFALLGCVDFDVLDAVDEFLDACQLAGVRGSAAMETRV